MHNLNRTASLGGLILGVVLLGYVIYELVLYPAAGFPTADFAVIVAGANTLRVGHLLKFGYAAGVALMLVGLFARAREVSPSLAQLAAVSAAGAATLYVASAMLGLRILEEAEFLFASKPSEAITTILMRAVTISLFEAAILASGLFALLISLALRHERAFPRWLAYAGILLGMLFIASRILPAEAAVVTALAAMVWAFGVAWMLWGK